MRYWWVNQNQTFEHEFGGGYLWSPKRNSNGARNPFYDFMTQIEPEDIVFSFVGGKIVAVGVAMSKAYTFEKPKVFGSAGAYWGSEGWKVDVAIKLVENPVSPKDYLDQIAPLLPSRWSPIRPDGNGNQIYLAAINQSLGELLLLLTSAVLPELETGRLEDLSFDEAEQEIAVDDSLPETMRVTLIKARRGQGIFRDRVQTIESACRVTGVAANELLIASHIKPWKGSDAQERLDGNNGLFLSPHVDKLFDKGFISFERSGKMLVSPQLDGQVLEKWSIDPTRSYGRFNGEQAYFLEFHNEEVFKSSAA